VDHALAFIISDGLPCREASGIVVPGVLRLPTPGDAVTVTTGTQASQQTPGTAAATPEGPAGAGAAAASVAATPQMQPLPRERAANWSAARPWDLAPEAEAAAEGAAAAAEGAEPAAKGKGKSKQRKASAKSAAATPKPRDAGRSKRGAADALAAEAAAVEAATPAAAAATVAQQLEAHEVDAPAQRPASSGRKRSAPGTGGRAVTAAAADAAEAAATAEAGDESDRENQDPAQDHARPSKRRSTGEACKQCATRHKLRSQWLACIATSWVAACPSAQSLNVIRNVAPAIASAGSLA